MSNYIMELAERIQKTRPKASIPVIIELKTFSQEIIQRLASKGFKILVLIKELKMVAGDIPAAKMAELTKSTDIIETLSVSCELEIL